MKKPSSSSLRALAYALRGGFLVRPLAIAISLGASAAILSHLEERYPFLQHAVPRVLFPSNTDAQSAQTILASVATSTMTVVSIVFAILLMTLTLASTQFSPRLLVNFVRDRVTQGTLGIFLGTFSYCIAAMPAARTLPRPFAPTLTVMGAMALTLICVGWLIYFIHHISNAISVNNIVDRIRRETELVVDGLMQERRRPMQPAETVGAFPGELDVAIVSRQSGYIRYVDIDRLRSLAKSYRVCLRLERRIGHFVPEGVALMRLTRGERITPERREEFLAAIDIGPTRTLQQDVEFGVVQIVDVALRAISPAVNDPTTAISCIDQLSSIMIRWIGRAPPRRAYYDPPHVLRVVVPWIDLEGLLDLAFEQIRHYGAADAAVSLRLMRAFTDIACTVEDPNIQKAIVGRGKRLIAGCEGRLHGDDLARLLRRFVSLEAAQVLASGSRQSAGNL